MKCFPEILIFHSRNLYNITIQGFSVHCISEKGFVVKLMVSPTRKKPFLINVLFFPVPFVSFLSLWCSIDNGANAHVTRNNVRRWNDFFVLLFLQGSMGKRNECFVNINGKWKIEGKEENLDSIKSLHGWPKGRKKRVNKKRPNLDKRMSLCFL